MKTAAGNSIRTLKFTEREKVRVDKAAVIYGWKKGESARFARQIVLAFVDLALLRLAGPSAPRALAQCAARTSSGDGRRKEVV
jgi:hypothetical protein